jgi:hypothetical protein
VIVGSVDDGLAPLVRVGLSAAGGEVAVEAAIDTGSTGYRLAVEIVEAGGVELVQIP